MIRAISLFLLLILLLATVFFSMANRELVSVGFWPLDLRAGMPLFLPILAALVIGFVCGWIGEWRHTSITRKQLRRTMRENRDMAVEIDRLKEELKAAQSTAPGREPGRNPQIAA